MLILTLIYLMGLLYFKTKLNKRSFFVLSAIPLILIIIFRFGYGADYFSYDYIYDLLKLKNLNNAVDYTPSIEPLFRISMLIPAQMGLSYHLYTVIICLITLFINFLWLYESDINTEISILLYYTMFFIVWNISALRQSITISILLYVFFNQKREFGSLTKIIAILVSIGFHKGALIFVPIYLLSQFRWSKKSIMILFVLSLGFNLIPISIFEFLVNYVPFGEHIMYYMKDANRSLLSFSSIMRVAFFLFVYFSYTEEIKQLVNFKTVNFILLSYIAYFFLLFGGTMASRGVIYGYILLLLYIPAVLYSFTTRDLKVALVLVIGFSLVSFYKEVDGLMAQIGYTESFIQLNKENIFTKNYKHFDTHHALLSSVTDDHNKNDSVAKFSGKLPEDTVPYNSKLRHLSVYFSENGLYGTINENSEVVELPQYGVRYNIIKDKAELKLDPFRFGTTIYRTIGTDKGIDYQETQNIVKNDTFNKTRFDVFFTKNKEVSYSDLDLSLLEEKFNLSPITKYNVYTNDYYPNRHYLELVSSTRTMYALLDENFKAKSSTLYFNIVKYDIHGFARGTTLHYYEILDNQGDVIWSEPISELTR